MSAPFVVGDVVRLRSGGPLMVVYEWLSDAKLVACMWWDAELPLATSRQQDMGGYREWNFSPDVLIKSGVSISS